MFMVADSLACVSALKKVLWEKVEASCFFTFKSYCMVQQKPKYTSTIFNVRPVAIWFAADIPQWMYFINIG